MTRPVVPVGVRPAEEWADEAMRQDIDMVTSQMSRKKYEAFVRAIQAEAFEAGRVAGFLDALAQARAVCGPRARVIDCIEAIGRLTPSEPLEEPCDCGDPQCLECSNRQAAEESHAAAPPPPPRDPEQYTDEDSEGCGG